MTTNTPKSYGLQIFGEMLNGKTYHERKAAYAVIPAATQRIAAVVAESGKLFLPGGGIEAGETPEQALAREVEEECAKRLHIARKIGEVRQYFYAPTDNAYVAMHAVFYEGKFIGPTAGQAEHRLVWVYPDDGAGFFQACHVWAAQRLHTYRK